MIITHEKRNAFTNKVATLFTNKTLCATLEKLVSPEKVSSFKEAVIYLKKREGIENSVLFGGPPSGYKIKKQFAFRRRGSLCEGISYAKKIPQQLAQSVDLTEVAVKGVTIGSKGPNATSQGFYRKSKRPIKKKKPHRHCSISFNEPPDLSIRQNEVKRIVPCAPSVISIKSLHSKPNNSRPKTQISTSPSIINKTRIMNISGNTITPFSCLQSPYESVFSPELPRTRRLLFKNRRVLVNGVCQTCVSDTADKRMSNSFITETPEKSSGNRLYQSLMLKTQLHCKKRYKMSTPKPEEGGRDCDSFIKVKRIRKGRVFSDAQFYFVS